MRRHVYLVLCGWFVLSAGTSLAGLPSEYRDGFIDHQVQIPKLPAPDDVSVQLDQAPWTQAAKLTGNMEWRRTRTADLPIWTYLFYDAEAIWIAYRCEVTPGPSLRAEIKGRDENLRKDDHVTIEIDAGATGRVFYRFVINPAGSLYDSVIIDKTWNSNATAKTATDEEGWTAVLRVPFSDFGVDEPPVETVWPFNVSTRTGIDNCWSPVLGGYHTPEEFALAVFGGEQTTPVRMEEFKPLKAGRNRMRVQSGTAARYLLEGIDRQGRRLMRQQGPVATDGTVEFDLVDDKIHHVNFSFQDAHGRDVLAFWRAAEIPPLVSRLPSVREKAESLRASLDLLGNPVKANVEQLLQEFDALLETKAESIWFDWSSSYERLRRMERSLTDAWLFVETRERIHPEADFAIALASPMDKVMIKDFPCPGRAADRYLLSLALNEREAMQVVVIPVAGPLEQVTVTASPAVHSNSGARLAGRIHTALVGHVQTKCAGSYLPDYVGWYPDPILHFQQTCDIADGEYVAFWVDVAADKNAVPGRYESTIAISAAGCKPLRVRLDIQVWNIELPDGTHLRTAFTYNQPNTRRLYPDTWSDTLARRYHDFLLDHRLNVDSLYGKQPLDLDLLRHAAQRGMNAFNLFYAGRNITPEATRRLLEGRMPALKEAGLDHLAYLYGFDEVNDEMFSRIKEVFGLAKALYPDLPRMTTGYDNTFGRTTGLREYVDMWVPLIPRYNMVEAERLREEGKEMWWYLCVGPRHPFPNWFVESPAIEARLLMGAMSYKYRVDGVLYFMMNNWSLNDQPITSGPYTDWFPGAGKSRDGVYANGDGSIFCAGPDGPVTTMRLENIRDGLEDYEYLHELAKIVKSLEDQPTSLQQAEFLQHARDLLAVPSDVVASSSRYTGDPDQLYAFRNEVAESIMKGHRLQEQPKIKSR